MLVAVLSAAVNRGIDSLSRDDRHLLYILTQEHLSRIQQSELKEALSVVKNLTDKAREAWNALVGPARLALGLALLKFGFKAPELSRFEMQAGNAGTYPEQIQLLTTLAKQFGYKSVYILIDKVDENALTGKANASLTFVKPLLSELSLLEADGIGFKFFLWDQLEEEARDFSRPDRIKVYLLKWTADQLKQMLSRRLKAYSAGRVESLSSVVRVERDIEVDSLIVLLSGGSPRNIIRICKSIFDQQSEINAKAEKISEGALYSGIESIAGELAREMLPENVLRDLKKLKRTDFTITNIYADVFRISQPSGLQKVQSWQDLGAVVKIGTRQTKRGNRPSNLYAIVSPLVLKHIFSDMNVLDFWDKKVRICACGHLVLRDWDTSQNQF